ncbi:LegC family aminotransferase [Clostridiales bacterium COT073_COT-073]|nr:LegC family aminotransferase [Clostridiales bacterium COT073_COT-073]
MSVNFIPLSVPNLQGNELNYVTEAITKEWVSTAGSYVVAFEENMAKYLNVSTAVACQSGTAGLHVALRLCDVKAGEAVIVPTLTFIAAVNPVKYLGAEPIFMDCDDSLCLDVEKLSCFCEQECQFDGNILTDKQTGRRIKAIVVVHVFGNLANMEHLMQVAEKYHLKVVEDATEALGSYYTSGTYCRRYAGTIGDFGVYSFNGNKIITTGGGGMIVARRQEDIAQAKHLTQQAKADEVRFEHDEIGYNYRMTNLQAALGVAQLEKLEDFILHKKQNYEYYQKAVNDIRGLRILGFEPEIRPNYWFYSLQIDADFPMDREEVMAYFQENKIQTRPIWGLIHEQKPYLGSRIYQIEKATWYWERILNIPCSSNLSKEDAERVVKVLAEVAKRKKDFYKMAKMDDCQLVQKEK